MTQLTLPIAIVFLMSLALGCSLVWSLRQSAIQTATVKGTCQNGVCVIEPETEDKPKADIYGSRSGHGYAAGRFHRPRRDGPPTGYGDSRVCRMPRPRT